MKNKLLSILVVVLVVILTIEVKTYKKDKINISSEKQTIEVKDSISGNIETKDLENYVIGVVAAEMPASFSDEALKAQAIASRTYAYYKIKNSSQDYDIIANISNQDYIDEDEMHEKWQSDYEKYYEKIKSAVDNTKNEIMTYDGDVIEAFYFAMSNGYTEDVATVFQEERPYLESVESKWDNDSLKNYEVNVELSKKDFCQKLNIDCEEIIINKQTKDNTGRTTEITINSIKFLGTEFRRLLNLRSTDFEITINDDLIYIKTKGYGHGVGMSQYGANGMAKEGYDCYEILKYYYKGIKIEKI